MRTAQPILAFILLVTIQCVCGLPGSQTPSPITPESPGGATEAPEEESVGTINLVVSQVQTGPPENLQYLDGIQNFHNGDGVLVTEGGKGKLALNDGTQMTLFNETEVSGVNVSTSPPRTDLFLQSQGFLGYVPPGGRTTVNMPNGAKFTILGTHFFILSNIETKVATAGNFDGTVLYTPPGGTEEPLPPGLMVDILPEGDVDLLVLPFTPERFEQAVDSTGTPTAGLNSLRQDYKLTPLPRGGAHIIDVLARGEEGQLMHIWFSR